jgi:hypothetical protein
MNRMIKKHNDLNDEIEESRIDYDMEKMTINQLKERAKDVDETAKRGGSKAEELYKSILSNSSDTSGHFEPMSTSIDNLNESKEFNPEELMKRVEYMS